MSSEILWGCVMIADSFEIDGQEIDIHIVSDMNENCFSIFAKNQHDERISGFEFRVKKECDLDEKFFSQGAPAFAIISFMRRQIEENHWQIYQEDGQQQDGMHPKGLQQDGAYQEGQRHHGNFNADADGILYKNPREAGRQSFLKKIHYCHNPFTELNRFSHDEWDQGWAEAAQKNPAMFDFNTDSFQQ